jgi:hypothetical protein
MQPNTCSHIKPLLCNNFTKMFKSLYSRWGHSLTDAHVSVPKYVFTSVPIYVNLGYMLQLKCLLSVVAHFFSGIFNT